MKGTKGKLNERFNNTQGKNTYKNTLLKGETSREGAASAPGAEPVSASIVDCQIILRGLVLGSEHSSVNVWASGAIEAPLESSVPTHFALLVVPMPGVLQRRFKIGPLEPCMLFEIGPSCDFGPATKKLNDF